ncbi:MAG: DUF1893 domain-containing protein, partial [archaeon]
RELGCRIHDGGSYALKQGPEFETAKEIDDLRRLGYDVVGMTTLTEAKIAKQAGIPLGTVCLVTNLAQGKEGQVSDAEVQAAMKKKGAEFIKLLRAAVGKLRSDLEIATASLAAGRKVSIVNDGKISFESEKGGVSSLLEAIDSGRNFSGSSAADTIIGKAAAVIFKKLGIRRVYAGALSKAGKEALEEAGIEFSFGTLVENILNREKTSLCPFEKIAIDEEKNPEGAIGKMRALLASLKSSPVS